jgi:dipeptidase D
VEFWDNYPDMDMISLDQRFMVHIPLMKSSVSSSQKFWKFVLEILANIPVK